MAWVKLDDGFTDHPKIDRAGPLAGWLYVCGLTYSARHLTDGFIPEGMVVRLSAITKPQTAVEALVAAGLWEPIAGGYQIHDYLTYNPSAEKVRAERDAIARRVATHRGRQNGQFLPFEGGQERSPRNAVTSPVGNAVTPTVTNGVTSPLVTPAPARPRPVPSRPVPTPSSETRLPSGSPEDDEARAPAPATDVPESLKQFDATLSVLRGYHPTPEFYAVVQRDYGHLNLDQEAIKALEHAKKKHYAGDLKFVLDWLGRSDAGPPWQASGKEQSRGAARKELAPAGELSGLAKWSQ